MRKKIMAIAIIALAAISLCGCASWQRFKTNVKSEVNNGLQRTITIYTATGDVIATYEGKIDIAAKDGGYVKFDYDGKRYIYYNCFVESIADIK